MREEFLDNYQGRDPEFGFPVGAGNTLGHHAFITKYSRRKDDNTREHFWEALRRVIEGCYSIQFDHAMQNRLPWDDETGHASAQEAYVRAWAGKWSPPGRGWWVMGTEIVNGRHDGSPLYNCSFISTSGIMDMKDPSLPFARLMEELMLGIGTGFDCLGAGKLTLHHPEGCVPHQVADSREGWVESVANLLRAFFLPSRRLPFFDYSKIRPAGSPIKGFGGVASGPAILQQLHQQLVILFSNRQGENLTSTDIVDVCNLIGKAVVAGNVRRSAEIALGLADDDEFLDLKDYHRNPVRCGENGWSHLSNNSVIAQTGQNLDHLVPRIALNGEPGIYWLDVAQNFGRLADPPDGREYRTAGINPCQLSSALLLTPDGIRTLGEIEAGDTIWSQDGWVRVTRKTCAGIKPVFRYRTTAGWVDATENHRVISAGVKVEVKNARSIDRLRGGLNATSSDMKDVMTGLVLGDGSVHSCHGGNDYILLHIGHWDQDYFSSEIAGFIGRRHGKDSIYRADCALDPEELPRLPFRRIPKRYLGNASVLRGLYSANGSVVRNRVTLKTASAAMRDDVQVSLSALGIASYYTTNKPTCIQWRNGEYESRQSYDVNIGRRDDVTRFAEVIGFIQEHKTQKLAAFLSRPVNEVLSRPGRTAPDRSFPITNVEPLGEHEVWDITVEGEHHTYWSGGLNISNCGEVPLENFEKCNLVETFPTRCDSLQDYLRSLKYAFLYSKTVTLLPVKWGESNEVMTRNRRIGVSMSGVAQFAEEHGWAELRRWQDAGYAEIRRLDRVYSEWLGIRESIRLSCIKPSGTVSLLWGVTPGVHYPREREFYVRTVRDIKGSPFAKAMAEAGYPVEPSIADPDTTVVISFPVTGPDMRSEREVSIFEKTALAALSQRHWSDLAVSCTVTFRDDEAKEIPAVLKAFDGQLKSISFLPMAEGTYQQAPYQRVSKETWDAMRARVKPIDWEALYDNEALPEAAGENYCANDVCII
jgi:Ribonucleotide reductase alpha domain/LAGLIDADG-like domain